MNSAGNSTTDFVLRSVNSADSSENGDIYLNPVVASIADPARLALLSIGAGDVLTFNITYSLNGINTTAACSSAPIVLPTGGQWPLTAVITAAPQSAVSTSGVTVTDAGQVTSGNLLGYVQLVVTAPNLDLTQAQMELSDLAGINWTTYTGPNDIRSVLKAGNFDTTDGYQHLTGLTYTNNNHTAQIYFPPERDELATPGVTAMTLRVTLPGTAGYQPIPTSQIQYVTTFQPAFHWDASKLAAPFLATTATSVTVSSEAQLLNALALNSGIDTITLGASIIVHQPIAITHSVQISGANASIYLQFNQDNGVAWPYSPGVIYENVSGQFNNIRLSLSNFKIQFDQTHSYLWADRPDVASVSTPYWDPQLPQSDDTRSIISTAGVNHSGINVNNINDKTYLTIFGMNIGAFPLFDVGSLAPPPAPSDVVFSGEGAMDIVKSNTEDNGIISNNILLGGTVNLKGDPWQILSNQFLGSASGTFSGGAIADTNAHDLVDEYNNVEQVAANGAEIRLTNIASTGFNNVVSYNIFGSASAGAGNPSPGFADYEKNNSPPLFKVLNAHEVMLEEAVGSSFEGRPSSLSSDGRILAVPTNGGSEPLSTGAVVSILSTSSGNAGRYDTILQFLGQDAAGQYLYLMADPLPALPAASPSSSPPSSGGYVISISAGFVGDSFLHNTLHLQNMTAIGMTVGGNSFGTIVEYNTIIAGGFRQCLGRRGYRG